MRFPSFSQLYTQARLGQALCVIWVGGAKHTENTQNTQREPVPGDTQAECLMLINSLLQVF